MTCEEAIRAIEAMIDREIDDDERLQLEAHLAGCESCRRETEERRAFSDRIGRDLGDAFRFPDAGARRVIIRPRRFPWVRAAAVIVVGIAVGYVGSASGFFRPATAEAREVANLSALKDAYADRDRELVVLLEREAGQLEGRVARAPDGAVRDATTLCFMNAVTGLAGREPLALPTEPEQRARIVAQQLSSPSLSRRGGAVLALKRLTAADASHIEKQIVHVNGANRTFFELYVKSVQAPTDNATDCTIQTDEGAVRITQRQDGCLRVEAKGSQAPAVAPKPAAVYEGVNLLDFQVRYPKVATQLRLRGVDGDFTVYGVHQKAPGVETRPAAFVPAVVWSSPDAKSGEIVEAMSVHAVMSDCARSGRSVEETERKGMEVLRRVHEVSTDTARTVRADPERVRILLADFRGLDAPRLALARERLQDEVAELERRVAELERRLDCVRKASVTLEYAPR